MVDIATIRINVDAKEVPKAVANLEKLTKVSRALNTSLNTMAKNQPKLASALTTYNKALRETQGIVGKVNTELEKYNRRSGTASKNTKDLGIAARRLGTGLKNAATEAGKLHRTVGTLGAKARTTTTSMNNTRKAAMGLSGDLGQAEKNAARVADQFARMGGVAARTGSRVKDTGAAVAGVGRETNVAARHVGNMTAQFNDIGVMLASGQNPLVLAMQQGTQVTQIFDELAAKGQSVGSALFQAFRSFISPVKIATLAIIAGGVALGQWAIEAFRTRERAQTLTEAMAEIEDSFSTYQSILEKSNMSMDEARQEFGSLAESMIPFMEYLERIERADLSRTLDSLTNFATEAGFVSKSLREFATAGGQATGGAAGGGFFLDSSVNRTSDFELGMEEVFDRPYGAGGMRFGELAEQARQLSEEARSLNKFTEAHFNKLLDIHKIKVEIALLDGKRSDEEKEHLNTSREMLENYAKAIAFEQQRTALNEKMVEDVREAIKIQEARLKYVGDELGLQQRLFDFETERLVAQLVRQKAQTSEINALVRNRNKLLELILRTEKAEEDFAKEAERSAKYIEDQTKAAQELADEIIKASRAAREFEEKRAAAALKTIESLRQTLDASEANLFIEQEGLSTAEAQIMQINRRLNKQLEEIANNKELLKQDKEKAQAIVIATAQRDVQLARMKEANKLQEDSEKLAERAEARAEAEARRQTQRQARLQAQFDAALKKREDELEIITLINRHGKESAEVEQARLRNIIEATEAYADQRGFTEAQKQALVEVTKELEKQKRLTKDLANTYKAVNNEINNMVREAQEEIKIIEKRMKLEKDMLDTSTRNLDISQNKLRLSQTQLTYGRQSTEAMSAERDMAEQIYIAELKRKNISDEVVGQLVERRRQMVANYDQIRQNNEQIRQTERIVDDIAGAWADWLVDGGKSFENFANTIKGIFRNLLRQMIKDALLNKINFNFGSIFGGGGGGNIFNNLLGGLGRLFGAGQGPGLSSASALGATSIPGLYGFGMGTAANFSAITGGLGAGAGFAGTVATGGTIPSAALGFGGGIGSALTAVAPFALAGIGALMASSIFGGSKPKPRYTSQTLDLGTQQPVVWDRINQTLMQGPAGTRFDIGNTLPEGFEPTDLGGRSAPRISPAFTKGSPSMPGGRRLPGINFSYQTTHPNLPLYLPPDHSVARQLGETMPNRGLFETVHVDPTARDFVGSEGETEVKRFSEGLIQQIEKLVEEMTEKYGSLEQNMREAMGQIATSLELAVEKSKRFAQMMTNEFESIDDFNRVFSSFMQNFYSETERLEFAQKELEFQFKQLGLTLPETKEGYRELVEAQSIATEEGRHTYAQLLKLSETFVQVTQSSEGAADAVQELAENSEVLEKNLSGLERFRSIFHTEEEQINRIRRDLEAAGIAQTPDEYRSQVADFGAADFDINKGSEELNRILSFMDDVARIRDYEAGIAERERSERQSLEQTFQDTFYTEAEKLAEMQRELESGFRQLGLTLPETNEQYRKLVEAQNLSTESGKQTYLQLLRLSSGFFTVRSAMMDAAASIEEMRARILAENQAAMAQFKTTFYSDEEQVAEARKRLSAAGIKEDVESYRKQVEAEDIGSKEMTRLLSHMNDVAKIRDYEAAKERERAAAAAAAAAEARRRAEEQKRIMEEQDRQFKIFAEAMMHLNDSFVSTSSSARHVAQSIISMFNSVEDFASQAGSYYQNFFTENERLNHMRQQLAATFQALNISAPKTRKEFRAIVEAQDLNTESGRKTFATLIDVAEQFANVTAEANNLNGALDESQELFRDLREEVFVQSANGSQRQINIADGSIVGTLRDVIRAINTGNVSTARHLLDLITEYERSSYQPTQNNPEVVLTGPEEVPGGSVQTG